jgi:hypothetical protein
MLKIHSKVNTPYGEGILVSMVTEYNGLYIKYERTKCVVWFGTENPGISEGHGRWIVREFSLKELVAMNQDNIRNEKIDDILCRNM